MVEQQKLIQRLLQIPAENQTLEFKLLEGSHTVAKVAQTAVAMANTSGGLIVLGIDDPEKTKLDGHDRIKGVDDKLELLDEIVRELGQAKPGIANIVGPLVINDRVSKRQIGLISVSKATEALHSLHGTAHIRLQRGNTFLSPSEIVNFNYAKGFKKADQELVEVDFRLLETNHYQAWRQSRQIRGGLKSTLLKVGLARRVGGRARPTLAAVLLFADYPSGLTASKPAIRVFRYRSERDYVDVPDLVSTPKTIDRPVVDLIRQGQNYVLDFLGKGIELQAGFKTKHLLPARALGEAITNAVIHRDYHLKRDISVRIYPNRVEVISPGLLPYNITLDNIGRDRADNYRNDLLVKHLREFVAPPNLDENEGVRTIRRAMKAAGLFPPVYSAKDNSIKLSLFTAGRPATWDVVEDYLKKNSYVTNNIARQVTGVDNSNQISKLFRSWVEMGLLLQISNGSKRQTKYRLADRVERFKISA